MKKTISLLGLLTLVGCPGAGTVEDPYDPWYVQYWNGHPLAADPQSPSDTAKEADLMWHINQHRLASGQNALVESRLVSDIARAHSVHMAIHSFEGPVNPEGDGPSTRASKVGLAFWRYDETISAGMASAHDVYDAWLAVPAMHDRLHDPFVTHGGAGHHYDPTSGFGDYWTVGFRQQ